MKRRNIFVFGGIKTYISMSGSELNSVYLKYLGLEHMKKVTNSNYSTPMETSWP